MRVVAVRVSWAPAAFSLMVVACAPLLRAVGIRVSLAWVAVHVRRLPCVLGYRLLVVRTGVLPSRARLARVVLPACMAGVACGCVHNWRAGCPCQC